jgi:hypothetical protein
MGKDRIQPGLELGLIYALVQQDSHKISKDGIHLACNQG